MECVVTEHKRWINRQ